MSLNRRHFAVGVSATAIVASLGLPRPAGATWTNAGARLIEQTLEETASEITKEIAIDALKGKFSKTHDQMIAEGFGKHDDRCWRAAPRYRDHCPEHVITMAADGCLGIVAPFQPGCGGQCLVYESEAEVLLAILGPQGLPAYLGGDYDTPEYRMRWAFPVVAERKPKSRCSAVPVSLFTTPHGATLVIARNLGEDFAKVQICDRAAGVEFWNYLLPVSAKSAACKPNCGIWHQAELSNN
jgi:hypothetical protein